MAAAPDRFWHCEENALVARHSLLGLRERDAAARTSLESPAETVSCSDTSPSSSDDDVNEDGDAHGSQTARPCRKRRGSPFTEFHARGQDVTPEQCPRNILYATKRPKRSHEQPSTPGSASQHVENSSSNNHARRLQGSRQLRSSARARRLRKHNRIRECDTETEDDEYEVEKIVNVRLRGKTLQYRAKWLGYEEDLTWYDASNFKNSPHRLRDFHAANPSEPGPPCRLVDWIDCWNGGKDVISRASG